MRTGSRARRCHYPSETCMYIYASEHARKYPVNVRVTLLHNVCMRVHAEVNVLARRTLVVHSVIRRRARFEVPCTHIVCTYTTAHAWKCASTEMFVNVRVTLVHICIHASTRGGPRTVCAHRTLVHIRFPINHERVADDCQ